ncbi:sugar ABC transporter permease [Deinococcus malanensis]|uniref:Sugar ABC transporter permease n=1 Tax=Deinococcus malanensis TaxID=1706855 RepID=A0ABQ2F669_9DEIO|nr:carbohydrate ABC transporter permease [Deinococcus malanensis]GGK43742.1 sugar ABC transporter permease [Deinococcus malanensis]
MRRSNFNWGVIATIATFALGALWAFPLLWAVLTALKPEEQAVAKPLVWLPNPPTFTAFQEVIALGSLSRWYFNSTVTSLVITIATVVLAALAAYAFSQLRFRGKQVLFWTFLAGIMIPFEALLIPLFRLMHDFGTINTHAGIILPQIVSPVAIFVFKSFFDAIPKELREAAVVDGASEWRILYQVYIPLSASVLWGIAIVTFIAAWNNFLWPFIITTSSDMMTLPLGLTQVQDAYGLRFARTMAVAVLAALPVVIAYLIFQRRVTEGFLSVTGIKG